jgi:hypothetical protein
MKDVQSAIFEDGRCTLKLSDFFANSVRPNFTSALWSEVYNGIEMRVYNVMWNGLIWNISDSACGIKQK